MTTRQVLDALQKYESRNITFMEPDGSWPIIWARAEGNHVWDPEGRRYLDLTAAFGVAAAGHANPRVVLAGQRQMERLLHAMGDVHPHELKARLARELSRLTFERWGSNADSRMNPGEIGKTIFCNSGFEAVEAALKTALLATRKAGVIAFEGAYHGLGYGALNTTHRMHFRGPFKKQLKQFAQFVPFPELDGPASLDECQQAITSILKSNRTGAILLEPVQARGGIRVMPPGFLSWLRSVTKAHGVLLVLDEIYTGLGRTGAWFACEHSGVVPDLICLGKALTGGFPLSACIGSGTTMDAAWPPATGEAIHTSTFLGHPVGCAMALAQLQEIRRRKLIDRSAAMGRWLLPQLDNLIPAGSGLTIRGRGLGLMAGVEIRYRNGAPATEVCLSIMKSMLNDGFIVLPEGEHANILSLTPPLTIQRSELTQTLNCLKKHLEAQVER
jgi:4-aminobutyrate aminotransferase-like enzyme